MKLSKIVNGRAFENSIALIIIINAVLIGVETYFTNSFIYFIQTTILVIFILEILLRFFSADSFQSYLKSFWNVFDIIIILPALIPESLIENSSSLSILRILRTFRILRVLRVNPEIKIIFSVLVKSVRSLIYNILFFLIFFYLFSVIGVTLFKLPEPSTSNKEMIKKLNEYQKVAPNAPNSSPDPYNSLGESFFTLFRITTGEDWTDIYYNLIIASQMGIIPYSKITITLYHVLWMILSAFLLLNLIVASILNNYQVVMEEIKEGKTKV